MDTISVLISFLFFAGAAAAVALAWRPGSGRLTAFGIAAFGCLVLTYHILGVLAAAKHYPAVRPWNVVLVSAVLCASVWMIRWRVMRRVSAAGDGPEGGRAGAAAARVPKRPAAGREVGKYVPQRSVVPFVAAVVLVGGYLTCAAVSGLSAPPRGWDILAYHLPRTLAWLQHGDLGAYGSTGAFYPGNAGLPILSLLLSGSDRFVPITQLPFALLSGVALFGLAREIGASARSAAFAVLVFLISPIVFFHTTIAKDDLVVTAMVLAGALFLTRSLRSALHPTERLREIAASGFALGLALGTKYSILPYVIASVLLFALLHATRPGPGPGTSRWRGIALMLGVFALAIAVPSAFWYVRNAVATGNPVAPLSLGIREFIASPGVDKELQFVASPGRWWVFPWTDRQLVAGYNGTAGYGAAFAMLLVPGLALAVRGAVSRRLDSSARAQVTAVLLSIVVGVIGWWFGKYHLPRLLLPVVGLACAPMSLVFEAGARKTRLALVLLLVGALGFSAAETLRVAFDEDDITWSHAGGVDRHAFYRMPDLIYTFPPKTKILLLRPSSDAFYETYRYPLAGYLPGNEVVMEEDVGIGTQLAQLGARAGHADLLDRKIEYVFMRTLGVERYTTGFDEHPDLYENVLDSYEPGYAWYRETYAVSETGEILGRAITMTKVYQVLNHPPTR
jgi:hypothetical protein